MPAFLQKNIVLILQQFAIIIVFLHDLNQMFDNCGQKSNFISFYFAMIFPRPQLCQQLMSWRLCGVSLKTKQGSRTRTRSVLI